MNTRKIIDAAEYAMKSTVYLIGRECTSQITAEKWAWPVAPTPRDIVDKGQVRASQKIAPVSRFVWSITWSAEHSIYVFLGYITRSGSVMPARNAPRAALEAKDWDKVFSDTYRKRAGQ